jgi:hypothetical protein
MSLHATFNKKCRKFHPSSYLLMLVSFSSKVTHCSFTQACPPRQQAPRDPQQRDPWAQHLPLLQHASLFPQHPVPQQFCVVVQQCSRPGEERQHGHPGAQFMRPQLF